MIRFAQKPGQSFYWVTRTHYTKLAGRIMSENLDIVGPGRFQSADLAGIWAIGLLKIFKDGDHLCALVSDDLQEGVAEFAPLTDADLRDQITDLMTAYRKAHPDFKWGDRCDYWEPHEIAFMAEQYRARRPSPDDTGLSGKVKT